MGIRFNRTIVLNRSKQRADGTTAIHEPGHALGLMHSYNDGGGIMSYAKNRTLVPNNKKIDALIRAYKSE